MRIQSQSNIGSLSTVCRAAHWALAILPLMLGVSLASGQQTQIQYLSGTDKDNTVLWDFMLTGTTGRLANVQTTIPVPSCWELMGFGIYQYGSGSTSNGETGNYSYTFPVTNTWTGKRIFLVFEGAFTDTSASINGQSVGFTHQGGYYEFKYDVTTNVVVGASTNVLQATVKKWSFSTNIMRAESLGNDYWVFGGIYRPVYLEAKPAAYIDRIAANPLANGQITVNAYVAGISNNNFSLSATVTDTNGAVVGSAFTASLSTGQTNATLSASLGAVNPWSAEFPTLYTLTVQLSSNASLVHTVTNQIGFRTITFTNNVGFFVNGRKVFMRGVCRHEEWPTTGRTTSRALSDLDIGMMKDANFNAVRLSHYPPNKVFLEECDRLGMYTLDELASYQHGGDQGGKGPMDIPDGIRLIGEMIRRDVNHPCIIAWDNGNEAGWNPNLDGRASGSTNYFALNDIQDRMFLCPNTGNDNVYDNVITHHYANWSAFTNDLGSGKTVFMPTEILHALYDGGGGAALQDYWDAMRTSANGSGVFLWSWDDAGMRHDDTGVMDVSSSSGPDGIVGPFREKEASYYSYKAIFSPVQIGAPNPATFTGTLNITNRFDFTDLSQCTFDWQLGWFADPTDPTNYFSTNALTGGFLVSVDSGSFSGLSLSPGTSGIGSSGSLALPSFPGNWTNYDALRLTATDLFGNNIYTWTWPLRAPTQIRDRILGQVSASAPAITAGTNASEIIVTNGPRIFHFSKTTGVLNSLTVSNVSVSFANGPRPAAGAAWTVASITNYSDGTNYFIAVNNLTTSSNAFQWMLRPDGWLKLSYCYTNTGPQSFMGITFDYPSNKVAALNWLGQGPYRVWKNRSAGQEIFTHIKAYNDVWTGQTTNYSATHGTATKTQWAYPEFAGYHGQLFWANLQTTEQPITVVTPATNLFFRVLTPPNTDQANTYKDPPFPSGGISLLHGISAIGDKFDLPASLGPASQTNVATGRYTGEVNFFFGPLPASGADRDGNGLIDAWELQYFGALGQNPDSKSNADGQPLMVENAFGLSPLISNAGSSRLPHIIVPGTVTPMALGYDMPVGQLDQFSFVPRVSDNLLTWYSSDFYPQYFLIQNSVISGESYFNVQPDLPNWPIISTSKMLIKLKNKF